MVGPGKMMVGHKPSNPGSGYTTTFLNQVHAGRRLVRAWFLIIASVHKCLYGCMFVCLCVRP